ncbi:MAG: VWA domain-containing protein [Planctomycetota bacterium]|nr:VWA domain-containing protein [Planctomycetota bacterium]
MAVLFAMLLVVVLGMIALGVDTGVVMVRRAELQRSADAATLAAASVLAQGDLTEAEVVAEAISFLSANGMDPDELDEDELTIQFGAWDADTHSFSNDGFANASAVRIAVEMSGNELFFSRVFGANTHDVSAEAIAVTNSTGVPRDIMVVIDCSGSMDSDDDDPEQPMTAVKDAAQLLCDVVRSDDRVGLTVYNCEDPELGYDTGKVEIAPTSTVQFVKTRINDLTAAFYTGGTNIAGGIRVGGQTLDATARADVEKLLVVLTDGKANRKEPPYQSGYSAKASAIAWANDIRALGIRIDAISLGDNADHNTMAQVAGTALSDDDPVKGKHYAIEGDIQQYTDALQEAFQEIGQGTRRVALVR